MNPASAAAYLFSVLRVEFFAPDSEYESHLIRAIVSIPDPDDSPYLAAALAVTAEIWSNDPHLKQQSLARVFSTKELIDKLLSTEL